MRAITKDLGMGAFSGVHLAELLAEIAAGTISATIAKEVLAEAVRGGQGPKEIIAKKGLLQIVDADALDAIAQKVLAENAEIAARYKAGNANVFGALVGAAMRATGGKANAKALQDALKKALG
ncbi:MAG: hypothetical protein IPK82_40780 [Polyangiaceae bacterium]|nr:hypothetical protein [Polyangiaceae bacterium]